MNIITLKKILTAFARMNIACCALGMSIAQAATVDVLVLYDTHSRNYFNGDPNTAMINWVNQINSIYRTSQVDIQLRLVGVRQHEETGADMSAVLSNLRVDSEAIALRNQLGADFVTQLHQTGRCGIGYLAVDKNWAWNVLAPNCGPLVMAHELGHNMGLDHSRRQGDTGGVRYRYGLGYGVDNLFATVMAYPSVFTTSRMGIFSNPNLLCKGVPCGVPEGQPQEAYAAKALHNVRDEIAGFRTSTIVNDGPIKVFQHCNFGGYAANLGVGTYNAAQLLALGVQNDDLSSIQVPSGYKVTLYREDNLTGGSVELTGNDTCLVARSFNDTVSSIRVEAVSTTFSVTIQAENYALNNGVQLQATTDTGEGQNVGWIDASDWMVYNSITIPTTGTYSVDYRIASPNSTGKLSLDLNGGSIILGQLDIPNTGGWQNWTTITQTVTINAGTYNFGIYAVAGGWNINWIRIRK